MSDTEHYDSAQRLLFANEMPGAAGPLIKEHADPMAVWFAVAHGVLAVRDQLAELTEAVRQVPGAMP